MPTIHRTDTNDEIILSSQWQMLSKPDETFPYKIEIIEAMGGILIRFLDSKNITQCGICVENKS